LATSCDVLKNDENEELKGMGGGGKIRNWGQVAPDIMATGTEGTSRTAGTGNKKET